MSSRKRKSSQAAPAARPPVWLILGGALLVMAAIVWGVVGALNRSNQGTPNLTVDQESVDFGNVKLGETVTANFTLTNTGDGPLRFSEAPFVELKAGC